MCMCFLFRCQLCGCMISIVCLLYGCSVQCLLLGVVYFRLLCIVVVSDCWLVSRLCQVGEVEFLKLVMNILVLEFSVLIIIFGLVGLVILMWWFCSVVGSGVMCQLLLWIVVVFLWKFGRLFWLKNVWCLWWVCSCVCWFGFIVWCSDISRVSSGVGSMMFWLVMWVVRVILGVVLLVGVEIVEVMVDMG